MASSDFRVDIQRLIKAKQEEIKVLEATLRMISDDKSTGYASEAKQVESTLDDGKVDLDSLGVEMPDHGPTLAERVKSALTQIPVDKEFTVPHIEALLRNKGFELAGKNPRARLAMIMTQLESEGLVVRTAKPKGFKPHRFKLSNQGDKNISPVK